MRYEPATAIRDVATIRIYDRARRSRDARFDGRFFIAVTTTGIYCRPICPARNAHDDHVWYYPSAAAAEASGFRPCLRCRPEASPGTPAWLGTSSVVSRALRLIGEGALDEASGDALADRLGVTARHLRRLFLQHLGATPSEIASTRRLHFAKKLLDETPLACEDVAFAAGFRSVRRFNAEIRRVYQRTPTELRRAGQRSQTTERGCYRFRLAYRPPYAWSEVLRYLAAHAIAGVEDVSDDAYRRTITSGDAHGTIAVTHAPAARAIAVEVRFPKPQALLGIVERVRRVFDLGADPELIAVHLGTDPALRAALAEHPGIRVPGAWDPCELAVHALAGPATAAIAATFGAVLGERRIFPRAAQLADAALERAGVPPPIAEQIRAVCRGLTTGAPLALADPIANAYIAMRAFGEPDAYPRSDPAPETWRPWRAYAAMLLWLTESADEIAFVHVQTSRARSVP